MSPVPAAVEKDVYVGLALALSRGLVDFQRQVCARFGLEPRGELHVTLAYLGERTAEEIGRLVAALAPVVARPGLSELAVLGVGGLEVTDAGRRPATDERIERLSRVLWLTVEPSPALRALRARVWEALAGFAAPAAGEAYFPHVTLGSIDRREGKTLWDVHDVPKVPSVAGLAFPGSVQLDRAHLTCPRIHPAGFHEPVTAEGS